MDRCVWSGFEQEKLIQAESQNIPHIALNLRGAQTANPKIQQR